MPIKPSTIQEYLNQIQEDRQVPFDKLRNTILENIPKGFEEGMNYGMPSYYVPHSIFPAGYHCDPKLPLPFASIANQKNFIALYHMGVYADESIYKWFVKEYGKRCKYKLDMGKSCVRFKKMGDIPYDLIAELISKFTPESWVELYQNTLVKK